MKKFIFLSLLFLSYEFSSAQFNADKEPFQTRSLSNDAIKNVTVKTSGGSILAEGISSTADARIEVYVRANNTRPEELSKAEIQKRLDEDYELDISVSNNKVTAIAKTKPGFRNWKKGLSISFRVYVPRESSTDLSTSGGSIRLSHLSGEQDFATSGGSLSVSDVSGDIKGHTSGGSIMIEDSKDKIDLSTSGGSIEARNCSGKMKLNTSGGSLKLDNLKGSVNASTSGGSIAGDAIDGDLYAHTSGGSIAFTNLAGSLETSTSGGAIDVSLKSLGQYVRISNSGGNINVELPDGKGMDLRIRGDKIRTDKLNNFSGKMEEREIKGQLNGGGVEVDIEAGSGRINLAFK